MKVLNSEDFRCKVCGGTLEIEDPISGMAKCLNCGNQCTIDLGGIPLRKVTKNVEEQKVFVSMTNDDVKKERKKRIKNNEIFLSKAFIALIAILITGIYSGVIYMSINGIISLGITELIVVSLIGLGAPILMSIFSRVYKDKNESLFVNVLLLIISLILLGITGYFAYIRYFYVLIL